jgi:hypothetical protein
LTDQSYLFTGGFVPWWNEYPGMHIPAPLELGSATVTNIKDRAKEILTPTKMKVFLTPGRRPLTISRITFGESCQWRRDKGTARPARRGQQPQKAACALKSGR